MFYAILSSLALLQASPAVYQAPMHAVEATIPNTRVSSLRSSEGETYTVSVALPSGPPPAGGYPVVYLLDANLFFGTAVEAVRLMQLGGELPQMIIVGVGYPTNDVMLFAAKRQFDLTPTAWEIPLSYGRLGDKTGGGAAFLQFLTQQVKPAIARDFQVASDKQVLVGDSLGGLFAVQTALTSPEAFTDYVITSPSLWWDDELLLRRTASPGRDAKRVSGRVFVGVGSLEEAAIPAARMVSNVARLPALLGASQPGGPVVETKVFEDETHLSVPAVSLSRGLRTIFHSAPLKPQ